MGNQCQSVKRLQCNSDALPRKNCGCASQHPLCPTFYLAINPKGRVPALVTENGTLTETPGLLLYVAQRYPNAELTPFSDSFALRRRSSIAISARPWMSPTRMAGGARVGLTMTRRSRR